MLTRVSIAGFGVSTALIPIKQTKPVAINA